MIKTRRLHNEINYLQVGFLTPFKKILYLTNWQPTSTWSAIVSKRQIFRSSSPKRDPVRQTIGKGTSDAGLAKKRTIFDTAVYLEHNNMKHIFDNKRFVQSPSTVGEMISMGSFNRFWLCTDFYDYVEEQHLHCHDILHHGLAECSKRYRTKAALHVIQEMEEAASNFAHRLVQSRTETASQTMDVRAEAEPYGWCFVALWKLQSPLKLIFCVAMMSLYFNWDTSRRVIHPIKDDISTGDSVHILGLRLVERARFSFAEPRKYTSRTSLGQFLSEISLPTATENRQHRNKIILDSVLFNLLNVRLIRAAFYNGHSLPTTEERRSPPASSASRVSPSRHGLLLVFLHCPHAPKGFHRREANQAERQSTTQSCLEIHQNGQLLKNHNAAANIAIKAILDSFQFKSPNVHIRFTTSINTHKLSRQHGKLKN
ncbi:hypothetical protein e1012e08.tmp0221 [Eimeria tenella]|uniref:Uncharacterized protein n=1 Tax=Eimeria tenella TaxID=5802 RepID=C8TDL9_EIMTE|nr:hypothetical protein e1012e08.tmp0221 [Eimeria tenella]